MALYDLDTFRSKIINDGLLDNLHLDPQRLDTIKNDDVALLKLGHRWVKQILFGTEWGSRFKAQIEPENPER
jgi:hypothetical protein